MLKYILFFLLIAYSSNAQTSSIFSGKVVNQQDEILIGVSLHWKGSQIASSTDINGWFEIPRRDSLSPDTLQINYIGFQPAQLEILPDEDRVKIILEDHLNLETIEVKATERGSFSSSIENINMENISACELKRAACCSLAESFETNGSVNVSYADALTGAREIEVLGLKAVIPRC